MGRDRQEKKLKKEKRVESDRDESIHYPSATRLEREGEKGKSIEEHN